ncbi:MAG TPA: serine kinase [Rhodobacterales bacterium]|nr:serine kinase [Rhodobacterales bacterium]
MIEGPSGSGKSALALQLIALGARLIADDRTRLVLRGGAPWTLAPERHAGLIEARGVGLIRTSHISGGLLALTVEMGTQETERLPQRRSTMVLGCEIVQLQRVDAPHFPSAILAVLKGGIAQDA